MFAEQPLPTGFGLTRKVTELQNSAKERSCSGDYRMGRITVDITFDFVIG